MLFDTHAHILKMYYNDITSIINEAKENNVKYITIPGTNIKDSKEIIETANKYENIYAMIGIHPEVAENYTDINKINEDLKIIKNLAKNKKVIAIGEIGLDNHWTKEYKKEQQVLLIKQINLANKLKLPIVLHIREATNEILEILKEHKPLYGGVFHSASFNEYLIKEGLKLGFHISFSGTVTFKNAKPEECVKMVPNDKLLIETDSPYLTPHPFRGMQNSPKYIKYTLNKIAEIKNINIDELENITTNNALKLFNIHDNK